MTVAVHDCDLLHEEQTGALGIRLLQIEGEYRYVEGIDEMLRWMSYS